MSRALFFHCSLALVLLSVSACHRSTKIVGDIPVYVVNGDSYSATAFARDLAKKLKTFDALAAKDPLNVKRSKESALREFTVSALLSQFAKTHHLVVSESDLDAAFDKIRKTYPDDLTFKAALAADGQTIDEWKASLKKTLTERKVFESLDSNAPSMEEDAKRYYAAHKTEFAHPAQIHLVQILVAKEDDAERLLHKLKSGASFSDIAKKFSISPEGAEGGDLGYINKGMVPVFDKAFDLPVGQVSNVTKSSYGFHIMKVLDKRAAGAIPYEQAKKGILRRLAAQREQTVFNDWLDNAIKEAKTERNDALIDKIRVRTEGEQE